MKDRAPRAIGMSPAGLTNWQAALTKKNISTANELLGRLEGSISIVKAREVLRGEKTDKPIWECIFRDLALNQKDFFTDAEWFGRDPIEDSWTKLLNLAEDASDRFGIVLPQQIEHAGFEDMFTSQKIQKTVPSGKSVLLEIPEGYSGYAIVLEQGVSGNIVLVAPSCLMVDSAVKGEGRLLPQHPPSPFKFLVPRIVGTNHLWAGIFAQLPDWKWLHQEREGLLKLEGAQVEQLIEYAQTQPHNTKQIWKSSYTVTAAQ